MSEIKLVLTDFDGTVAEIGKHVVSNAVREAVIACEERGIPTIPATGRYHRLAQPVLEILGFDGLGIFDNGATIQHCVTGEVVWSNWMPTELVREVAGICAPDAYWMDYSDEHNEHATTPYELDIINDHALPAPYVYALIADHKLEKVKAALAQVKGITFYTGHNTKENVPHPATGIQVNLASADKFHGTNALRDILGIPKEHILAIGDGDNDIALFENAGLKIAMGNATDLLKQKADYIVAPVQNDGFVEAMNKFVLNK